MSAVTPHLYVPDHSTPPDFNGKPPCLICPLPVDNKRIHVDKLPTDARSLAAGDSKGNED